MKAKRIFCIPWGDRTIASSRLRIYQPFPYLENAVIGTPKKYKKGDVLIIQKALRHDELEKAQKEGAKVVYDIDDNYMDKKDFVQMAEDADLVTVGSSFFHRYFPEAPVIDDSLDWDGTIKQDYTKTNTVGWVGFGFHSFIDAISPVFWQKGMVVRTIVGKEYLPLYNRYEAVEWTLDTVDKKIAECDFTVIYLDPDDWSMAKGMNKLLKSWAIGVPCFFSYNPEYDRVVHESGIFGYMTRNWDMQDYSKPWIPAMREYALTFSPQRIAKQWEAAIERL